MKTVQTIIRKLNKGYALIERFPHMKWFNIFSTVYLNFRCFPLNQAMKLPVFVYGWPKFFSLYGKMECVNKCYPGMVRLNQTNANAPSFTGSNSEINLFGKIVFHGKCLIYTANKINININGTLELGEDSKIMHFCNITAYSKVFIGAHSRISHRSQVLDTNFHYIANLNKKVVKRSAHPITIGKYCWICNSTTISGGAIVPDYTIVSSNSLVNKDFSNIPLDSIIGGIPAKLISSGVRKVENRRNSKAISVFFAKHPEVDSYYLDSDVDRSFCNADNE